MAIQRTPDQWKRLWLGISELVSEFGDRLVFIGGVAVFLHVQEAQAPQTLVEFSHDGDFLISLADYAALRQLEEVTANRRLQKHQFIKHGIDFDVYVEHNNTLIVPYDEAYLASSLLTVDNGMLRVASVGHLLVLKLASYRSRKGSQKGSKDERDLIRLLYVMYKTKEIRPEEIQPYLDESLLEALVSLKRSTQYLELAGRNAHNAKNLRIMASKTVDRILESVA